MHMLGSPPPSSACLFANGVHLHRGAPCCAWQHCCLLDCQQASHDHRLGAAPVGMCITSTAAHMPVRLQVLGSLLVVKDGVLTKGQADSKVGCLELVGAPTHASRHAYVLIEPYKRLTASDMVAKQLLSGPA